MIRLLTVLIIFLCSSIPAISQSSDLGNWIIYFGNKNLNQGFNWHHEVQYRNYNAIGDLEQLLIRTGIGKNLTEGNNNLLLGYGYILSGIYPAGNDEKINTNEHRIYQQFITKQSFPGITFQHRYRFEQRFLEDDVFKLRFRYFLLLNIPLNNKSIFDKTYYLSAYNELFIDTDDQPFDRNRVYAGIGYKLNKNVKFELGYMNQLFASGSRDQVNMICSVSF